MDIIEELKGHLPTIPFKDFTKYTDLLYIWRWAADQQRRQLLSSANSDSLAEEIKSLSIIILCLDKMLVNTSLDEDIVMNIIFNEEKSHKEVFEALRKRDKQYAEILMKTFSENYKTWWI